MLDTTINFSFAELEKIEKRDGSRETNCLTTLLFNQKTYTARENQTVNRVLDLRRTFIVFVGEEVVKIYAVNFSAFLWYLSTIYTVGTELEFKEEVVEYINPGTWTVLPR